MLLDKLMVLRAGTAKVGELRRSSRLAAIEATHPRAAPGEPFVPRYPSPVTWVEGLASLSRDEKDQILWRNLEALLKL